MHNLARSGGTMVCKCIGSMQGVRLFSEIHPASNYVDYLNVTDQAHRWYQLASQQEVDARMAFLPGVKTIHQRCEENGQKMVLRDWATVDFIGMLVVPEPSYKLALNLALADDFEMRRVALVRHPLDQWLSVSRLKIFADKLDAARFFYGYRQFAEQVADCFVRYEDFTQAPSKEMEKICACLALDYDPGFQLRWNDNLCITGDNKKTSRGSSGADAHLIRSLPRREHSEALEQEMAAIDDYQQLLEILGYRSGL